MLSNKYREIHYEKKHYKIYPNPISNILYIESDSKVDKIEIFDITGRLIKSESMEDHQVKLEDLEIGTYLVRIYISSNIYNNIIVKI